jgi:CysZ protein
MAAGGVGLREGLKAVVAGARFIVLRPKSWPWALVPVVVALVLVVGFGASLGALVWRLSDPWRHAEGLRAALGWLGSVGALLGAAVAALLGGLSLAQPLSGFALDTLSRQQEVALGGPERPDGAFFETTWRGLRVTLAGLAVALPIIVVLSVLGLVVPFAFVVTVPLKFVVAALLVAWDFLDYPLGLRGLGVRARLAFVRANLRGVLACGLGMAGLLLIPGVGLLMLPIGVAAATQLVVSAERVLPPPASK